MLRGSFNVDRDCYCIFERGRRKLDTCPVHGKNAATATTHGDRTRAAILAAGLKLMRDDPGRLSARRVGKALGMTHSAILYHYGTSEGLRDAIAHHAVAERCPVVIRYLVAMRHPAADALSAADRRRALSD
jgi:AcrR family transcriptional regulator